MIPFKSKTALDSQPERRVRTLLVFDDKGHLDLAEGITATDAATEMWEAMSDLVAQAWAEGPYSEMKTREALLVALLDRNVPNWRDSVDWGADD